MICPKCKNQNPDSSVFCVHCGHKLKVVCPKCKMTNSLNAQKCTHCGLRLIRLCPICQTPNSPLSERCKKCSTPLLKKCKSCGSLNSLSAIHCKKCAAVLEDKPIDYVPRSNLLIELTNGTALSENIAKRELAEKLIKKFFQTILAILKPQGLKALKLAPFAIGTELEDIDDKKFASLAEEILTQFQALNEKLTNVNISYDVKILVTQSLSSKHKFGMELLQKAKIGILCLDAPSAIALQGEYTIEKIAPGLYSASALVEAPRVVVPAPEVIPVPEVSTQEMIEKQAQMENLEKIAQEPAEAVQPEVIPPSVQETQPVSPEPVAAVAESQAPVVEESQPAPPPVKQAEKQPSPRQMLVGSLVNLLSKHSGGYISLLGDSGVGKKTIFNMAFGQLHNRNLCLLQADCHPSLNTVPFAALQLLIRSMFSLPLVNYEDDKIKNTIRNALPNSLGITDEAVINPIINLLVPEISDVDMKKSKQDLIFAVKTLFDSVKKLQKVVLLVKEIEFIDKASAEVFDALLNAGFLNDAFLITTTSNGSHISAFMSSPAINQRTIGSLRIMPLSPPEIVEELGFYLKNVPDIPESIIEQIKTKTKGWPMFLEEIVIFFSQAGFVLMDEAGMKLRADLEELVLPDSIEELIAVKLDSMFSQNEVLYQVMANAVCLGYTFFPPIIQKVLGLDNDTFGMMMNTLISQGLILTHDNVNFKFKNKFAYDVMKKLIIKTDQQEMQINANLLKVMMEIEEVNASQLAYIAKKAGDLQQAFRFWNAASKEASSVGDNALYLFAQKELLENIDYSDFEDKDAKRLEIEEQLGIANYLDSPEDSIAFLTQAIRSYDEKHNGEKVIELAAYVVKSLSLVDNSQEALEYIDKTIEYIDPAKMPLELALVKFIKLKFLVQTGYLGEAINLIQSDIMPSLQKGIASQNEFSDEEYEVIQDAVVKSQIMLIKALSLQGNKNYYNVLELFVGGSPDEASQIEVFVIDAMHQVLNGMPEEAEKSVDKTLNIIQNIKLENKDNILLELELIKLLGKALYSENFNVAREIPVIAQKSRALNNTFVYNCIQMLFIKQMMDNRDYGNAASITSESLTYFASQKVALFAILGWAISSKIQALMEDYDQAISIAQQALDVASKPQIQNNYFIAILKKLLSEYFISQNDFEMAKMHLEQAIEFTKAHELFFLQGELYIALAKLHQKLAESSPTPDEQKDIAIKLLDIAEGIATSMDSNVLQKKIAQAKSVNQS